MNSVDLTKNVAKMMKLPWALLPMAWSLLDEVRFQKVGNLSFEKTEDLFTGNLPMFT